MAELAPRYPFDGLGLPRSAGAATLEAADPVKWTAVAPFVGRAAAVAAALEAPLPPPGASGAWHGGRILWIGLDLWLVEGDAPQGLAGLAAVCDQSDAWAGLRLTGTHADAVLARLVPLDLDRAAFPPGAVARSLLRHVPLILVAGDPGFELLVPRSYAGTAVTELAAAMRSVAARAVLARSSE
ncbi:MAG: sarcosine oxidase subunit gamma [Amaricoccus sp.]